MEELKELIGRMTEDLREINGILAARSRELDRRAEFDKEVEEHIEKIRIRREHEKEI